MGKNIQKLSFLLTVLLLCSFAFSATADTTSNQRTVFLQEGFDATSALAYGVVPEHLYPFIYPGSNPYPWVEIDTANCVVEKIYVYNRDTDLLIPIGTDSAKTYAATTDHLYYVTTDNAIKKTDYIGSSIATLYTSSQGSIHNLSAFGNILYFIENGKHLIFLDTATGNTQLVLTEDDLVSAFVFNEDKLVWYDSLDRARYHNLTTQQSTVLKNPYEENALIAQYTTSETEIAINNNIMLYSSSVQGDSYNDVTFPLDDYGAVFGVEQYDELTVIDSFDQRYANSGECDGFAKYAHDCFWHLEDWNRGDASWIVNGAVTDDVYGNIVMNTNNDRALVWREITAKQAREEGSYIDNTAVVAQFFRSLDRGSFVRYGKANDTTKWDGSHSIVFDGLSDDGAGIIVYEANQDWKNGVGYQKYYFKTIHDGYEWILYYVEHSIGEVIACENEDTHKLYCDNCDGYLRREHTDVNPICYNYTLEEHIIEFDCCDGGIVEEHSFYGATEYSDETYHATMCSFCDGFILEEHPYESLVFTPIDRNQHATYFGCCGEVVMMDHEIIHNYQCMECGMSLLDPDDPGIYMLNSNGQKQLN